MLMAMLSGRSVPWADQTSKVARRYVRLPNHFCRPTRAGELHNVLQCDPKDFRYCDPKTHIDPFGNWVDVNPRIVYVFIYIYYLLISMQNLCWFICYDLIKILYIFYMGGEGWITVWLSTPNTKHLFFVKMRCVAQRAHRRPCGAPTRSSFGLANRVNPSAPSKKCRTFI